MTWIRRLSHLQRIFLSSSLIIILIFGILVWSGFGKPNQPNVENYSPTKELKKDPFPISTLTTLQTPPTVPNRPKMLFGVGTELDHALNHRITKESPIKLLTSWYNGPKDLGFMNGWRNTIVPKAYASGYSLHLIIYSNDAEQNLNTTYGPACGRPYPLSQLFLSNIRELAQDFKGGKLYVSMFTELQTYPCLDNNWVGSENYYMALKDQYLAAMKIFHEISPNSQVSLSWGGWQAEWDDADKGGGRSLFKHFADVMKASDFQSFQAMSTTDNLTIITDMTKALQSYGGGVMVSHFKPDNGSQNTFTTDLENIFTPSSLAILQQNGLFAFSFMDTDNMKYSETIYQSVKNVVTTYSSN